MTDITLAVRDGRITTTSRQIAEHFGKRHDHVLRAIANLDCSEEFRAPNFGACFYNDTNGRPRQEYTLTRDGFVFLCMGFTGKDAAQWKEKYISAFNAMEAQLRATPASAVLPLHITAEQAGELATLAAERFPNGADRPYVWSRFNAHFRIARYRELPAARFAEACAYLATMPARCSAAGPEPLRIEPPKAVSLPVSCRRWLVRRLGDREELTPVPDEACVMTPDEFLAALADPSSGLPVSRAAVVRFATLMLQRLGGVTT